ncbi:hypothetical protein CSC2_12490 [Clostridium zeae]|uniref:BppU N-terminal domain-containing protein n=1 Tax=Clostridium zeae TaxID=2759022 RepID=A0ABQ1E896_9CLOT|nr:BppU family phage baseplate upper protein [Clostridium zeae]GFZ30723.1 hypothetical protein CSC2_12490 [Clostridium zeae]
MLKVAKGDKGINFKLTFYDSSGANISLTGVTIRVKLFKDGALLKNITSVDNNSHVIILDQINGICQYTLQGEDTAAAGIYTLYISIETIDFIITGEQTIQYQVYEEGVV